MVITPGVEAVEENPVPDARYRRERLPSVSIKAVGNEGVVMGGVETGIGVAGAVCGDVGSAVGKFC